MTQGPKIGDVMIACQSGLLLCNVTEDGQLNILRQIEEYSGLYCINIGWAAAQKYVIITSRPRYSNAEEVPAGQENYTIASYTLYDLEEENPERKQVLLG